MIRATHLLRLSFVAVCALALAAPAAQAETLIRYSSYVPDTHPLNAGAIKPWAEEVLSVTEGRVRVEQTVKTVGSPQSQYDVVRDGLADMALITPGYTPGRFDLAGLGEMALLSDDPLVGSVAFQRFFDKHLAPLGLFGDVHVLAVTVASPGAIFFRGPPIQSLADLKGRKLRSPLASTIPVIEALGAIPVQKPATELYELLAGGVLDGSLSGAEQAITWHLDDVADSLTVVPGGLYNSVLGFVMNKDAWEKIGAEDRARITAISGEALAYRVGMAYRPPIEAGLQAMRDKGKAVAVAGPQLMMEIEQALGPVEAAVLETARRNGLADPEAALADYRAMIEQLSAELPPRS